MTDLFSGNNQFTLDASVRDKDRIELVMHRFLLGRYMKKTDIDAAYRDRADQAHKLGIRFGAYQVIYPSHTGEDNGAEQAKDFLRMISSPEYCNPGQKLLLAVDWEETYCMKGGKKVSCGTPDPKYIRFLLQFQGSKNKFRRSSRTVALFRYLTATRALRVRNLFCDLTSSRQRMVSMRPLH
jgi:hypothetical protein